MSKILFMLDNLPPTKSANGICVNQLLKCFNDTDEVFSLCLKQDDLYRKNTYYIPDKPWNQKIMKLKDYSRIKKHLFWIPRIGYRIKRFIFLPIWPVDSIITCINYYKKASYIINDKHIDKVVSVNYPGETLLAMVLLKKKYKDNLRTFMYPLDVSFVNPYCGRIEKFFSSFFCPAFFRYCGKYADKILVLENAETIYKKVFNEESQKKFLIAGIPLITSPSNDSYKKMGNNLHFVFSGTLDSKVRNPKSIFKLLDAIGKATNKRVIFDLYGSIDNHALNYLHDNKYNFTFVQHGWINSDLLDTELLKADVLINIGNNKENLIPSKLFKYMSLNKPIIHSYVINKDPCLPYLKKYRNSIILNEQLIDQNNISNELVQKILEFSLSKNVQNIDLKYMFPRCTPEYTVNLFKEN